MAGRGQKQNRRKSVWVKPDVHPHLFPISPLATEDDVSGEHTSPDILCCPFLCFLGPQMSSEVLESTFFSFPFSIFMDRLCASCLRPFWSYCYGDLHPQTLMAVNYRSSLLTRNLLSFICSKSRSYQFKQLCITRGLHNLVSNCFTAFQISPIALPVFFSKD